MNIYKLLDKYKKSRQKFFTSEEYTFFQTNRPFLYKMPKFSYLNDKTLNEFDIMRMNILLQGYLNKTMIEEETLNLSNYTKKNEHEKFSIALKEKLVDQPYLLDGKSKIYIPFFSKAINLIYLTEPLKLSSFPYNALKTDFTDAMVDPFDTYGYELFNSYFTRLIKITESKQDRTAAFFHYDTNTIYIINDQGRLDCKIVLFDRFLNKIDYNHMLERIKPVMDAYYACDRKLFLDEMRKNGFMSTHLYYLIKLLDWRHKK